MLTHLIHPFPHTISAIRLLDCENCLFHLLESLIRTPASPESLDLANRSPLDDHLATCTVAAVHSLDGDNVSVEEACDLLLDERKHIASEEDFALSDLHVIPVDYLDFVDDCLAAIVDAVLCDI